MGSSRRRGRGRLSTWRLAPAWPSPRGRAASPAPSPPLSAAHTPRPGRDTSPPPPLAAGKHLSLPSVLVHLPGHPGRALPTPDSGISCRFTQLPRSHPCSTPLATLSSAPAGLLRSALPRPRGPLALLWQRWLVPDARPGALGDRQLARARARAYNIPTPNTHSDTQHSTHLTHRTDPCKTCYNER